MKSTNMRRATLTGQNIDNCARLIRMIFFCVELACREFRDGLKAIGQRNVTVLVQHGFTMFYNILICVRARFKYPFFGRVSHRVVDEIRGG